MKTRTITQTLYEFDELSDAGKMQARDELLEDPWYFWTDIDVEKSVIVDPYFENGPRPEWQAAFSFCQGDGLNLYGELSYNDLRAAAGLEPIGEDITIRLKENRRYTYSRWNIDYPGDILTQLEEERGERFAVRQSGDVAKICDKMEALCSELYDHGSWLIFEAYLTESSIYEGRLFDKTGHWSCSIDDVEEVEA